MSDDNFFDFIQKFHKFTRCTKESPILLLLDNHVSHRTYEVLNFCRENGIHVLSFPPHTSHRLQPLDVAVFGPVQKAANKLCEDWVKSNPGRVMQPFDLPAVYTRALELGATEQNIKSGFRASGIWPLDRQVFQEIDFMPSMTTDRPLVEQINTPIEQISTYEDDIPEAAEIIELPHNRSQQSIPDDESVDEQIEERLPPIGTTSTPAGSLQDLSIMLENIKPFPKAPPRKAGKRGRKPQKSTILTSDDSFESIRAEKEAKEAKLEASEKKKAAAIEKKQAALLKKATAKKKAQKPVASQPGPSRISQRRRTIASYAPVSSDSD